APSVHRGCGRIRWIELQRSLQQGNGLAHALFSVFVKLRERAKVHIVSIEALGRLAGCSLDFGLAELRLDRADNATGDPILQLENVVERAVEAVGPDGRGGGRIGQLTGDAHAVAGSAYATFEHVAYAEFPRYLLHIDRLALVGEARIARDHKQPVQPRDRSDDLLGDAIDEIFLVRVAAQVLERQHR